MMFFFQKTGVIPKQQAILVDKQGLEGILAHENCIN